MSKLHRATWVSRFAPAAAIVVTFAVCCICFLSLCQTANAGTANSLMDISRDGLRLACSNRDSGTVSIVDLKQLRKVHEVQVGHHPEGVSFVGATAILAVAVHGDDKVVFLDTDSGTRVGEVDVFDEPYGVVGTTDGSSIFVTLDYPGEVVQIDAPTWRLNRSFPAGSNLRGIALDTDQRRLYVSEYYTGLVRSIDIKTGKAVDEWPGATHDNLARQLVVHPSRPKLYLAHSRSRVTAVHGEGSIFPSVSIVDTGPGEGRRRKRVPMDSFYRNLVTSNPWELDITPDGRRLFVVFGGTDDMFVCDVIDDDYREITPHEYVRLGRNPRAVRVSPDGTRVFVYNALDFEIVVYDRDSLDRIAAIRVCDNPLGDEVLQGKILFYSALQPMTGRRWISCSSCHPDGEPDGRTWHNPEGLRNTQPLAGLAWTHPIHWSADRDEVQDFEFTIRGQLMQGRGLIRGDVHPELGSPNGGRFPQLDALAAYTNSHEFAISPYAKNGLSEAARRGREIFLADETRCATCHSGPLFTDSRTGTPIVRHDVGTGQDDPGEKMGPAYDTPTLLGVYRSAPYLHHGMAKTLEEVLTEFNRDDRHGRTSHLSEEQRRDLVEFLKALPFEDPQAAARSAGYRRAGPPASSPP